MDVTSQQELEGAKLQVIDKNGNVVDEWISGKTAHVTTELKAGETYTLRETVAPVSYTHLIDSRKFSYPQNSDHKTLILQNKNKKRDSYHTRYVCSKSLAVSSRYGWNLYPLRLMTLQDVYKRQISGRSKLSYRQIPPWLLLCRNIPARSPLLLNKC